MTNSKIQAAIAFGCVVAFGAFVAFLPPVPPASACLSYGLKPQTAGFKECIDKETSARGLLVYADEQPSYGPQLADHP